MIKIELKIDNKVVENFEKRKDKIKEESHHDEKILDWNYLNRKINEEWHNQKADMQGVTFIEFKTTCLAHIRNQLYSGISLNDIMIGKSLNEIEQSFADELIGKIEKEVKKKEKKVILNGLMLNNTLNNVELFYKSQPFFYDKNNMFWFWNKEEYKWEIVDDIDIMNELEHILGFQGETVNSKIKNEYIESFKRIGRKNKPKDAPKKWIQFKDKAFSIKSNKVYDVTPDYFFTNPIPLEIGKTNETPFIDKLFKEWVGEKYKDTLYETIAYCCYTNYPIHIIICLVGSGRNGKSKFQELLTNFIGLDNVCSTELDILINSRFESFKLYKKLVCRMGETNFGILNKTSLLKRLTGQDLIGFEFKNKKPFDDVNYAKIIINSNSLPTSEDTSEGFYRRWLIIEFSNKFPEGKDILKDIPKEEYNNLAKKVIEILPELLEKGIFTNMGSIEERKKKYILASNPLSLFMDICCKKDIDGFVRYSELYMAYSKCLININRRVISKKEFGDTLNIDGYEVVKTTKKINEMYVSDRWINGINLNQNYENMFNDNYDSYPNIPTQLSRTGGWSGDVVINGINVLNFIKKEDRGNGVHIQEIKDCLKIEEKELNYILETLLKNGDIYNNIPDRYKFISV